MTTVQILTHYFLPEYNSIYLLARMCNTMHNRHELFYIYIHKHRSHELSSCKRLRWEMDGCGSYFPLLSWGSCRLVGHIPELLVRPSVLYIGLPAAEKTNLPPLTDLHLMIGLAGQRPEGNRVFKILPNESTVRWKHECFLLVF